MYLSSLCVLVSLLLLCAFGICAHALVSLCVDVFVALLLVMSLRCVSGCSSLCRLFLACVAMGQLCALRLQALSVLRLCRLALCCCRLVYVHACCYDMRFVRIVRVSLRCSWYLLRALVFVLWLCSRVCLCVLVYHIVLCVLNQIGGLKSLSTTCLPQSFGFNEPASVGR